jgi:Flp pilus assembly pilin Flp
MLQLLALRVSQQEDGQGLAEYALILALIAIIAIVALLFLGDAISGILSNPARPSRRGRPSSEQDCASGRRPTTHGREVLACECCR